MAPLVIILFKDLKTTILIVSFKKFQVVIRVLYFVGNPVFKLGRVVSMSKV